MTSNNSPIHHTEQTEHTHSSAQAVQGTQGAHEANSYSAATAIGTVFQRELRENLLKKATIITLIIAVLLTVGGVVLAWFFTKDNGSNKTVEVAVVGEAPFTGSVTELTKQIAQAQASAKNNSKVSKNESAPTDDKVPKMGSIPFASALGLNISEVKFTPAANAQDARAAVENKSAVAALIPGEAPHSWTLLHDDAPEWLPGIIQESIKAQSEAEQIVALGGNPADFSRAVASAQVSVEKLTVKNVDYTAVIVIGVGVMIMITGILMFGGAVAQSVIEEKSSRVIEIMLATVRPLHLLTGKILGAAVAGLVMMSVVIISAVIALIATGLSSNFSIPWASMALLLPFFLFGYLFFASLYAAAGSMVSRMEDFSGAQMPIMMLSLVSIYVPAFGWQYLDSTFMQVTAWIPPISVTVAPLQYATGNFTILQLLGSLAVTVIGAAVVVWLAAKIYPRNVLRTGAPVSWRKALGG